MYFEIFAVRKFSSGKKEKIQYKHSCTYNKMQKQTNKTKQKTQNHQPTYKYPKETAVQKSSNICNVAGIDFSWSNLK